MITANQLRQKYLDFFQAKGHAITPSASLIPENDPTVLFTTAGMHPLVPYLLGEKHPAGNRLVNAQKCIRTSDIDEVGDPTHHTFFEMLGNWSLGDYFKKEAIEWSFEFLTDKQWLGLDKNKIAVSVFAGDNDSPFDDEAYNVWKEIFIKNNLPLERIAKLPKKNNWWGLEKGPCGPDSEMFYWAGDNDKIPPGFNDDNDLWIEIWNDVFMQYDKKADGMLEPLAQKNVDTGMGLERVLAALNGVDDNYRTELFWSLIQKIEELSGKKYDESDEIKRAMRIIADHIKAAVFILGDEKGIAPSNVGAGYILRRLIRRAVRNGFTLGVKNIFTFKIAEEIIKIYQDAYQELQKNKNFIIDQFNKEEEKFSKTLEKGIKILNYELRAYEKKPGQPGVIHNFSDTDHNFTPSDHENIPGKWFFDLYQTYGFPLELSLEELKNRGVAISSKRLEEIKIEFKKELEKHQELSRTASAGMFKGGLADASEETKKLHTAAHLMLAALRKVLGDHVIQKGSNITAERLRFDFSHSEKLTPEQIKKVEDLVNEAIKKDLPVNCEEMTLEQAKNINAMGVFESRYGEQVKVYTVGKNDDIFSCEICGGPHVDQTGKLGNFKIIKEESSSAGVRRIKATLST